MVLVSHFDYDGETYADARNQLMFEREQERFEETVTEDMDAEIHDCECGYDEQQHRRFENDKTALVYCSKCGGVCKRSLPRNHF